MPDAIARRWFLGLATLLVPLMGFAALLGVAWPGLYRDSGELVPQLVGQDWVTLALATPVLGLALGRARRGSRLAWIVALGVVGCAAYGHALDAFATRHNELFFVYVAILGASVWALVAGGIGGDLLFEVSTLGVAILAIGAMQALDGQGVDAGLVAVFVAMTVLSLGATFLDARAVRTQDLRVPA